MTLSIDGTEVGQAIEIASWAATGLFIAVAAIAILLLVRPSRRARERREAEQLRNLGRHSDEGDAPQLWAAMDRMEARLAVLERALADQLDRSAALGRDEREAESFAPVEDGRDEWRKE